MLPDEYLDLQPQSANPDVMPGFLFLFAEQAREIFDIKKTKATGGSSL